MSATAKTKLVGKHKKTGRVVEFHALYPEMLENVPVNLRASAADRIRKYREIVAAIRVSTAHVAGVSIEIPWTMLDFGEEYGREEHVDLDQVAYLTVDWRDENFHNLRVTALPIYDAAGKIVDVRFDVGDGWHRRTTLLERIYAKNPNGLRTTKAAAELPCFVTPVDSVAAAAGSFSAQNSPKEKKNIKNSDVWRARVVAKDVNAMAVVTLAAKYGFNAESLPRKRGWPFFCSGQALERMMFEFSNIGPSVVARVLDLLSKKNCIGVYNNKRALESGFIGGLCHFIALFEVPGYAHAAGIEQMLAIPNVIDLIKTQLSNMSNNDKQTLLPVAVSWGREENSRYNGYAAAIARVYQFLVPEPNSKKSHWAKCPSELRRLMHDAPKISDKVSRKNFIAQLQTKLEKRKKFAHWRIKFQRPLTK